MKKRFISVLLVVISTGFTFAQNEGINKRALFQHSKDSLADQEIQEPGKGVNNNLDSLLSIWYVQRALKDSSSIILYEEEDVPAANMPDSIYIRRLNNLPSVVSLPFNDVIRNHIVFYIQKIPDRLEMILGLSEYYLPLFEEILDLNNIPLEIRALPIIESALNPVAISRVGATGMWQFMLGTGRQYGLTINSFVDERRDPVASAHAAAKFLNDLYKMYGDWTLVIAAYNCGPGNVNKAIKRANGQRDYWEIYPYLPRETRNYVPAFIAVNYALRYYKEHRLTPKTINLPTYIDTFMVNTMLHFDQVADVIGMPIDELRDLNPQYKKNVIPGVERPYELRIPLEYTSAFIEKEAEIYGHKEAVYFNKDIVVTPNSTASLNELKKSKTTTNITTSTAASTDGRQQKIHRVQKGESLNIIAQKNGVRVSDLQYWNNLSKNATIHPGQKIIINIKGSALAKTETETPSSTDQTAVKTTTSKQTDTKKTEAKKTTRPTIHTVKSGESLWDISQKYDDVAFYDLLKVNGMNKKSKIYPGQKLKLP